MNFQIFEDQENVHGNAVASFADARKERVKLAPLANKAINNENAFEKQVRPIENFCLPLFPKLSTFSPLETGRQIAKALGFVLEQHSWGVQAEKRVHCH